MRQRKHFPIPPPLFLGKTHRTQNVPPRASLRIIQRKGGRCCSVFSYLIIYERFEFEFCTEPKRKGQARHTMKRREQKFFFPPRGNGVKVSKRYRQKSRKKKHKPLADWWRLFALELQFSEDFNTYVQCRILGIFKRIFQTSFFYANSELNLSSQFFS